MNPKAKRPSSYLVPDQFCRHLTELYHGAHVLSAFGSPENVFLASNESYPLADKILDIVGFYIQVLSACDGHHTAIFGERFKEV